MTETNEHAEMKHEKYAGPSVPALALLEGHVYGVIGGIIGAVGGAALSGTLFKPEDKLVVKVASGLEHFGLPPEGKVGLMIASAVIGSTVIHKVGNVAGIAVGVKKAQESQAQFDRTQHRIARLEQKVEALSQPTPASFAQRVEARQQETPDAPLAR